MISYDKETLTLICDKCGEEKEGFADLEDVLEYLEEKEWESEHGVNLEGEDDWVDICPRCDKKYNKQ